MQMWILSDASVYIVKRQKSSSAVQVIFKCVLRDSAPREYFSRNDDKETQT